jgi:hypothetical protein
MEERSSPSVSIPGRLQTHGGPVPVQQRVTGNVMSGVGRYDFSQTGTFLYVPGESDVLTRSIFWLDAPGAASQRGPCSQAGFSIRVFRPTAASWPLLWMAISWCTISPATLPSASPSRWRPPPCFPLDAGWKTHHLLQSRWPWNLVGALGWLFATRAVVRSIFGPCRWI